MLLLHLGTGSHGDSSMKLFGSHKLCYDGQWPLTGHYFKHCPFCGCQSGDTIVCASWKALQPPIYYDAI